MGIVGAVTNLVNALLIIFLLLLGVIFLIYYVWKIRPRLQHWKEVNDPPPSFAEFRRSRAAKSLTLSMLIDVFGQVMIAGLVPAAEYYFNGIWAGVTCILIYILHRSKTGAFLGFIEQMLPGMHLLPAASLTWLINPDNLLVVMQAFNTSAIGRCFIVRPKSE